MVHLWRKLPANFRAMDQNSFSIHRWLGLKPAFCLVKPRVAGSSRYFLRWLCLFVRVLHVSSFLGNYMCHRWRDTKVKNNLSCISKLPSTKKKKLLACDKAGCDDTVEFPAPAGRYVRFWCVLLESSAFYLLRLATLRSKWVYLACNPDTKKIHLSPLLHIDVLE